MPPSLPARKAGGKRIAPTIGNKNLPILNASEIVLEDGTKIPVKIPPGMPPDQAQALLAYLQANPDQAKSYMAQAQLMLQTPGLAEAFCNMQQSMTPEMADQYAFLKDDPDMKVVLDDVTANGPGAFKKYWDDMELMAKISQKMRTLNVGPTAGAAAAEEGQAPAPPKVVAGLHDAAKYGDIEAADRLLAEGGDINARNDKGVTALGVAVGFNRTNMVSHLLSKGADVMQPDSKGNTVLHYAAGYGRREIAQILIDAGASLEAVNDAKQKPIDVAKLNKEKQMAMFLRMAQNTAKFGDE